MNDYPELIQQYLRFCAYRKKARENCCINLSEAKWFYPSSLLPLGCFLKENLENMEYTPPLDSAVRRYVEIMMGGPYKSACDLSYCPLIEFSKATKEPEKKLEPIYKEIYWSVCGGRSAFTYMIGELFTNVFEHSEFELAYVMAQSYSKKRFVEICVFDNGITIPGSFRKSGRNIAPDTQAIINALKGETTKEEGERGFGLGSSTSIATDPLKGEALIVSGLGLVYMKHKSIPQLWLSKSEDLALKGTLIAIRIPFTDETVETTKYVQKRPL